MPSSCCVVHCTSGYKSNLEKVSLFLFPKNEVQKNKWVRAIPRENLTIGPKTVVCEKHFTNDQIIRTWESGTGSNKIVINLKRPKLADDAVPCIFPGPKCLTKITKKRSERKSMVQTNEQVSEVNVVPTSSASVPDVISNTEYRPEIIFSKIFENPTSITLPEGWEYKKHTGKYSFITFYFVAPWNDGTLGISIEKQISFGNEMVITCKIFNKLFNLPKFGIIVPSSPLVENITHIIHQLNGYNACTGSPLEDQYSSIQNSVSSVGINRRFRHNLCSYLLDSKESKEQSCSHCLNLNSAFLMKRNQGTASKKNNALFTFSNKHHTKFKKDNHRIQKKSIKS